MEPSRSLCHARWNCKVSAERDLSRGKSLACLSIQSIAVRMGGETNRRRTEMGHILVFNHVTLDGVMQAPGREDEDRRGGFTHGGWARANNDAVMAGAFGAGMTGTSGLLLGRWTYESFAAFWPHQPQPNPFTTVLDNSPKFVVSRTLNEPLPWKNSTLLRGEAAETVATLKRDSDKNLVVLGSGELVQTLLEHDLVDELLLFIHPLLLGTGRRLFGDDGAVTKLQLTETKPTTTGVIIATYRRREGKA
jgi:dihydrofolate reductase